jgi:signal transduction histidine kinase
MTRRRRRRGRHRRDGPGIPAALQARIVELFFTARDVGQDSGLGLAITYRIVVAQHHRTIAVRSTPGDTVVTVRLPIAGDDTMGDAGAGAPR